MASIASNQLRITAKGLLQKLSYSLIQFYFYRYERYLSDTTQVISQWVKMLQSITILVFGRSLNKCIPVLIVVCWVHGKAWHMYTLNGTSTTHSGIHVCEIRTLQLTGWACSNTDRLILPMFVAVAHTICVAYVRTYLP